MVLTIKFRALKTSNLLLLFGAAGLAYYAYTRLALGNGLQFVPLGVTTGGNGLLVNVGVQNPTSNSATLNSFAGNLKANGSSIANVSNFQGVTIGPNAQTSLQFSVTPNLIALGVDLVDIAENGLNNYAFTLTGNANVNNTPLPVNITF